MSNSSPLRVAVVGGGFAAAELLLALNSLAGDRVAAELITPSAKLPFRPAAPGVPFESAQLAVYDLAALAEDAGASLRSDAVEAVAPRIRRLRLSSGSAVEYDALVLATGARARGAVPGAVTFRDHRDSHLITAVIDDLAERGGTRVVFAAPSGVSWTLPLYELALLTAAEIERRDLGAETMMITPEAAPLQVFGREVSRHVESVLEDHGVRRLHGVAHNVGRGHLTMTSGERVGADHVVAVPRLVGRRLTGVPADWNGFVATDPHGRVHDLPDVFAAGDMTQFPVKQGGLATQQADVIAAVLASRAGADVEVPPARHVLRTHLLMPGGPLYLRVELDHAGRPLASDGEAQLSADPLWWPAAKLFGRHLSPWMAMHEPVAA
jgi:sulfide:quinone oxidoreductase